MTVPTWISRFYKFWPALVGFITLIVGRELGEDSNWYAYVVAGLAAIGVLLFPKNTE